MNIFKFKKNNISYSALQVRRNNLAEVERFTEGEVKCDLEFTSSSGYCEIWCFKGDATFWILEDSYLVKDEFGNLDTMTYHDLEEIRDKMLEEEKLKPELSKWERLVKLFKVRR